MRLSNKNDFELQQLANSLRAIGSKIDPAILEELIDRRAQMSSLRALEVSLAYECAERDLTALCRSVEVEDHPLPNWLDSILTDCGQLGEMSLAEAQEKVDDAIAYLESRRLIVRSPAMPQYIVVCDEDEPSEEDAQ